LATLLDHSDGTVQIEELPGGRRLVKIETLREGLFAPVRTCETAYPERLVKQILAVKGPSSVCEEILREESPLSEWCVGTHLRNDILAYLPAEEFSGRRLLDFGCGCGASTVTLGRLFPNTEILAFWCRFLGNSTRRGEARFQ
jgi:hypothetical protein